MGCGASRSGQPQDAQKQQPLQGVTGKTGSGLEEECPICLEITAGVEQLPHKTNTNAVSQHRACAKCREQLLVRNASCPFCRTEMVWQTVFGFLDGLKKGMRGYQAGQHNQLADLMGTWMEYEMTRTQSDIKLFAREMASDAAIVARLTGALTSRNDGVRGWLRDTAGLWIRFYSMYHDGELEELSSADGERLKQATESAMEIFETSHGGHPHFVGAMYQQAVVAVLCATQSGLSTTTAADLARKSGHAVTRVFQKHYGSAEACKAQVRERLTRDYAAAASELVWAGQEDPIMKMFFP